MTLKKGQILEGHLTAGENFGRYPTAGGSFLTAESKEKSKKTFSFISSLPIQDQFREKQKWWKRKKQQAVQNGGLNWRQLIGGRNEHQALASGRVAMDGFPQLE